LLFGVGVQVGHFSHIFIDEAAQVMEAESLIPLSLADQKTTIVLAGDEKQIGPELQNRSVKHHGLGVSIMERLSSNQAIKQSMQTQCPSIFSLTQNYRSHPKILHFSSTQFYDGKLKSCAPPEKVNALVHWNRLPNKRSSFLFLFVGVQGSDVREGDSPSFFNILEAIQIVDLVQDLMHSEGVKPEDIGIISPYYKQVTKIQRILKERKLGWVKVGSVNEFQGKEKKAIFISTVRASKDKWGDYDRTFGLGLIKNSRHLNTALTRVSSLLVVVGDPNTLRADSDWAALIKYCRDNGSYIGPDVAQEPFVQTQVRNQEKKRPLTSQEATPSPQTEHNNPLPKIAQSLLKVLMKHKKQPKKASGGVHIGVLVQELRSLGFANELKSSGGSYIKELARKFPMLFEVNDDVMYLKQPNPIVEPPRNNFQIPNPNFPVLPTPVNPQPKTPMPVAHPPQTIPVIPAANPVIPVANPVTPAANPVTPAANPVLPSVNSVPTTFAQRSVPPNLAPPVTKLFAQRSAPQNIAQTDPIQRNQTKQDTTLEGPETPQNNSDVKKIQPQPNAIQRGPIVGYETPPPGMEHVFNHPQVHTPQPYPGVFYNQQPWVQVLGQYTPPPRGYPAQPIMNASVDTTNQTIRVLPQGDWKCVQCKAINYGNKRKHQCFQCKAPQTPNIRMIIAQMSWKCVLGLPNGEYIRVSPITVTPCHISVHTGNRFVTISVWIAGNENQVVIDHNQHIFVEIGPKTPLEICTTGGFEPQAILIPLQGFTLQNEKQQANSAILTWKLCWKNTAQDSTK